LEPNRSLSLDRLCKLLHALACSKEREVFNYQIVKEKDTKDLEREHDIHLEYRKRAKLHRSTGCGWEG
jgi:hypothetical protein